jgi:hypothetical protein
MLARVPLPEFRFGLSRFNQLQQPCFPLPLAIYRVRLGMHSPRGSYEFYVYAIY